MYDYNLLLLIKQVDRRSPGGRVDKLRINELGWFFVDGTLLFNGVDILAVLNQLLVSLTS